MILDILTVAASGCTFVLVAAGSLLASRKYFQMASDIAVLKAELADLRKYVEELEINVQELEGDISHLK